MARIKKIDGGYLLRCPGCKDLHIIDGRWSFNGNFDNPTFTPSLLSKRKHPKGYDNDNPAPKGWDGEYITDVCHSFITEGKMQFLDDSTHHLAGKTVELEVLGDDEYNGY